MDIVAMHIFVRQLAQQMGLQNVRGLLPEQIDLLLNASITDTLNQVINSNLGLTNDRVATDNSKIGQVNALSTLYQKSIVLFSDTDVWTTADTVDAEKTAAISNLVKSGQTVLYTVDASVNYQLGTGTTKSSWYSVRIIDDIYLANALQDDILSPRKRAPIGVVNDGKIDLYFGNDYANATPYSIRFTYVKKPNEVKFNQDLGGKNVDCDLPEYLHADICRHAVEIYQQSITGQIAAAQGREQQQRRETVRNSAQPTPYGAQNESQQ